METTQVSSTGDKEGCGGWGGVWVYVWVCVCVCICIYVYIYTQTIIHHKKNENSALAATWMDRESIILSEIRQKQILYDITYI